MLFPSPKAMAVRADDVTLGGFLEKLATALQKSTAGAEVERFLRWIAVVEIHLMAGKSTATIGTRNVAEFPKEGRRLDLAPSNALDLLGSIRSVIAHIEGSLVAYLGHTRF